MLESRLFKISALVIVFFTVLILCFYTFLVIQNFNETNYVSKKNAEDRKYLVLIVGRAVNESFLNQIYNGAQEVSHKYDCAVELKVPESQLEDESLQTLLDYASFVEPDGVIACLDENDFTLKVPVNKKGENIPLITLSHYHSEVPQISHIGTNYSELGYIIATKSGLKLNGQGSVIVVNANENNNPNYSTLMNSLSNRLSYFNNIKTDVTDFSTLSELMNKNPPNLIVCLTEEDTIKAAQMVSEQNKAGSIFIIGMGEGTIVNLYLAKGIVTELLHIDAQKMGKTAVEELFEYIKYGYANNFISAEVLSKKRGE